jgi:hypothetical protein
MSDDNCKNLLNTENINSLSFGKASVEQTDMIEADKET